MTRLAGNHVSLIHFTESDKQLFGQCANARFGSRQSNEIRVELLDIAFHSLPAVALRIH